MVDEDDKTTTATIRPITTKNGEVTEEWVFGSRAKLRLLEASNLDIVFIKIAFEFVL